MRGDRKEGSTSLHTSSFILHTCTSPPVWEAIPRLELGDWWKDEDLPIDWDRFLKPGPTKLEIGYGGGDFLLEMALMEPSARFIGIERFGEGHRRLVKRMMQAQARNVLPVMGDAYILLNLLFADASLDAIYINCPDPWPKARHASKRLLTEELFAIAARKLCPGGRIHVSTDDAPYSIQAARAFSKTAALESSHPEEQWLLKSPYPTQTRYERKWRREGREMRYFIYKRKQVRE
jgi:tRNA (guanine-N7-)-methyltransferase